MQDKRAKAIECGDKYYDTGKKCKKGHFSKRLTVDGSCVECRAVYQKEQRELIRKRVFANSQ